MVKLTLQDLSKTYAGGKQGLKQFTHQFNPGVIGLLGPNGAGKSTLMSLISTLATPTSGVIQFNGQDILKKPESMQSALGFLPQSFGVFPNLSGMEFLNYIGLVKGLSPKYLKDAIPYYLNVFNLLPVAKKRIDSYSGGMRQRIGIIQALLGDPQVILLDEPTVGLDPEERINFRNLLNEIATDKIILLSSHIVSDIETIADQIVIMKEGATLFAGSHAEAIDTISDSVFLADITAEELPKYRESYQVTDIKRGNDFYQVRFVNLQKDLPNAVQAEANLEDVYMYLTGKAI